MPKANKVCYRLLHLRMLLETDTYTRAPRVTPNSRSFNIPRQFSKHPLIGPDVIHLRVNDFNTGEIV